jgi:hypothetical protein
VLVWQHSDINLLQIGERKKFVIGLHMGGFRSPCAGPIRGEGKGGRLSLLPSPSPLVSPTAMQGGLSSLFRTSLIGHVV